MRKQNAALCLVEATERGFRYLGFLALLPRTRPHVVEGDKQVFGLINESEAHDIWRHS